MKKLLSMLLCLGLMLPLAKAERVAQLPALLKFSQTPQERAYVAADIYVQRTYPHTANAQVDEDMRLLIDAMAAKGAPFLPQGPVDLMPAYLDVGATVFRTGGKWMSFLTIARVAAEREQTYVDFDARAYDMETGERLTLAGLFPKDSPAWEIMAQEVRAQLSAYFEGTAPDPAALEALCSREGLENAAFTLSVAKLSLHYRADQLYPGKNTLMHVKLYYPQIRPFMTQAAQENTDNSRYKLIALTYDDGGARGTSNNVLDQLRLYGANATFFIVGTTIFRNHDVLAREHDGGYAVESHNYEHVYTNLTDQKLHAWREKMDQLFNQVIGVRPTYMRAPGGKFKRYIDAKVGLPIIQWSVLSNDVSNSNWESVAGTVLKHAEDGAVVLMHDLNPYAGKYTSVILPELENRGYLCVTVDEMFAHYNVPLEPDTLYYSCEEAALKTP